MNDHIDELAELYALGTLDAAEHAAVERHVGACAACARRLREAEATVTAMAELQPRHNPPEPLGRRILASITPRGTRFDSRAFGGALAAALIVAVGAFGYANVQIGGMHRAMSQDDRALAQIAAGPFAHVAFETRARPTSAQVLYSRDGAWYYVVVMHPDPAMQIAYVHDHRMEILGHVRMHGSSGTLYLPVNHKMDDLALIEDGTVIADAHLTY